ncbi:hypothetical protein [Streptomyces californicus]|uniref:hypothetical protein n=1 Tax=Streptomyces californicus TaxID=67351 RepID=UPI0029700035|nr:hypothetical protein [Streptomyces californicus]MDW4912558.1 hypothetical protein [Streptomyces californicus]
MTVPGYPKQTACCKHGDQRQDGPDTGRVDVFGGRSCPDAPTPEDGPMLPRVSVNPPSADPTVPDAQTAAWPPRRARLTLAEDVVHIGAPVTVEFTLAVSDAREAELDRTAPVSVLVIAIPRSSATLAPTAASYATDDETPVRFTFTASEPGEHRLRFQACDPTSAKVLQVVEATLPVAASDPLGRITASAPSI